MESIAVRRNDEQSLPDFLNNLRRPLLRAGRALSLYNHWPVLQDMRVCVRDMVPADFIPNLSKCELFLSGNRFVTLGRCKFPAESTAGLPRIQLLLESVFDVISVPSRCANDFISAGYEVSQITPDDLRNWLRMSRNKDTLRIMAVEIDGLLKQRLASTGEDAGVKLATGSVPMFRSDTVL